MTERDGYDPTLTALSKRVETSTDVVVEALDDLRQAAATAASHEPTGRRHPMTDRPANDELTKVRQEVANAEFAVFELQHQQGTLMQFVEGIRADAYNAGYTVGLHEETVAALKAERKRRS